MSNSRKQLVQELLKIEGVAEKVWPDRSDGFSSLHVGGKEFAHFHNDNELDIRLTKGIISSEMLVHPSTSKNHPNRSQNSPWIEMRFFDNNDIEKIVMLIKQSLKK
jgi:hypothetical protein